MKKILFCFCTLIWSLIVIASLQLNSWESKNDFLYTIYNDADFNDKNDVYVTENTGETGYLFHIKDDYTVEDVLRIDDIAKDTRAKQVRYFEGKVYLLISAKTKLGNKMVDVYNVIEMNQDTLEPLRCTHWFRTYTDGVSSEMTVDGHYIYLAELADEKARACLYAISFDDFMPIEQMEDLNIREVRTIKYSDFVTSNDGYRFVFAEYQDGSMTTIENGNGLLLDECYNEKAADLYNNKILDIKERVMINAKLCVSAGLIFLAGELIIIAIFIFFYRRNRVGYMIFIWELSLGIIFISTGYFLQAIIDAQNQNHGIRYVKYALSETMKDIGDKALEYSDTEEFYDSDTYRTIVHRLQELINAYSEGDAFANILLVDVETDTIIASAISYDRCDITKVYGTTVETALNVSSLIEDSVQVEGYYDRELLCFVSIVDPDLNNSNIQMVGVVNEDYIGDIGSIDDRFTIIMLVLFALSSISGCAVLLIQSSDLHKMGASMEKVAEEKNVKKPGYVGADMGDMWSGLLDISRSFKNINYKKFKLYEAYYRFAPKSVASLLGVDSVTEVRNGDSVIKSGTVAAYCLDVERFFENNSKGLEGFRESIAAGNINNIMELVNTYQSDNLVYQVSSDSDMSDMRFIMPDNNKDAIGFGIAFHKVLQKEGLVDAEKTATLFMHYSNFVYGVAGTDEHAMQIMIAPEFMKFEDSLKVLMDTNLRLVVSSVVLSRESNVPINRYIGFIEAEDGEQIKLYEILDACPDDERHAKTDTRELFGKALELFMDKDFYRARNTFARVLKANPKDAVARRYVFTCEKYLSINTENITLAFNQKIDY